MSAATRAAALALVLCLVGCRDRAEPAAAMPAPVSEVEARRGQDACQDYASKVCACAASKPGDAALRELCELAPAKQSALEMVLEVNRTTQSAQERYKTADTVQRYARSCIEGISDLASRGCLR
jgi:uncharacterized lipoprotein NlpE involved in copper resistance